MILIDTFFILLLLNCPGFDYDFTFVRYHATLQELVFNLSRDYLLREKGYPPEIAVCIQFTLFCSFFIKQGG